MARTRKLGALAVLLAVAVLAAACGGNDAADTAAGDNGDAVTVEMQNMRFEPAEITVAPGTEVVWENTDSSRHNVVAGTPTDHDDPAFESPELSPGESWSYVLEEEGEYPYVCTYAGHHLVGMEGVIIVSADAQ